MYFIRNKTCQGTWNKCVINCAKFSERRSIYNSLRTFADIVDLDCLHFVCMCERCSSEILQIVLYQWDGSDLLNTRTNISSSLREKEKKMKKIKNKQKFAMLYELKIWSNICDFTCMLLGSDLFYYYVKYFIFIFMNYREIIYFEF